MPTETVKKSVSFVCPFKVRAINKYVEPGSLSKVVRITDQVKVDKETLTVSPVTERFDVKKEIQTYKHQCGLELFQSMLAQGRVSKDASHDDGKHGLDTAVLPETIHDAKREAEKGAAFFASLASALGFDDSKSVSADELIDMLSKKVAENAAKATVPPANNNGGNE